MCSIMSVLCPLCAQTSFTSIDALRNSLIKVANGPLPCPICNELFLGLDKLTIHLFSHTNLMTNSATTTTIAIHPTINEKMENYAEAKITSKTSKSPTLRETMKDVTTTNENVVGVVERKQNKKSKEKKTGTAINNNNKDEKAIVNSHQQTLNDSTKSKPNLKSNLSNEIEQLSSCDICEFTFRNEQLRDMHFNLVHQNSPNFKRNQQKTLTIDSPTTSTSITATATENDYRCHLCANKTYKTKGSLRVHLKVVHMLGLANVNSTTKLNICDRIRHKEARVQKSSTSNTKATTTIIQQLSNNQNSLYKPTVLLQSTNLPTAVNANATSQNSPQPLQNLLLLQRMQQVKSENPIVMSSEQVNGNILQNFDTNLLNTNLLLVYTPQAGELSKDMQNKQPMVDNPKIWECDVCSKSFTTKYFLKKHKRLHTGEMPYTCEICARTFTFQQSYHKHLLYHSDEKPHICATCGRAFKEVSTLHNHERIHSGEKPFKCEICGKCFRQRVSFLVHTRIHTGVMPYKCEQCLKNFRYKVSLRTHKCVRSCEISAEAAADVQRQPNSPQLLNNGEQISNELIPKMYANQNSPASIEIAAINNSVPATSIIDTSCVEALLSKTIDDIVVESCKKMGIGNENNGLNSNTTNSTHMTNINSPQVQLAPSPATLNGFNEGSSSPLQKLQEMRLYSPKFDDMETTTTTTNDNAGDFSQIFFK